MFKWLNMVVLLLCLQGALKAYDPQKNLSWVQNWGYWLQNIDIDTIVSSPYDLVVIDYSSDGTESGRFERADIDRIHQSGKLALAYLSIGEAENYRFYWQKHWRVGKPAFIGAENSDWPGNYKVKFWYKKWWQKVLKPYLDRIIDAGFDGVYLDIVDAYWYWGEHGYNLRNMANKMVKLVDKISDYGMQHATDGFIVTAQNGVGILEDASRKMGTRYLNTIDAVGVESLFFNRYSEDDYRYRMSMLRRFDQSGKKIFNVEYIPESQYDAYWDSLDSSDIPIVGYAATPDAALDRLTHFDW